MKRPSQPRQFAVIIAVRSWWLLQKQNPLKKRKNLALFSLQLGRWQRLNHGAAILRLIDVMGTGVMPG
jgi:hypothetical protein